MARQGLRTLVLGYKQLSSQECLDFINKLEQAKLSMVDRKDKVDGVFALLEHNLELLGITGVEDKLQDNVCESIETIRNAGIRVWMLTGDKVETAKCVATAAGIKAQNEEIFSIQD